MNNLIKSNEACVTATIVAGNPTIKQSDIYGNSNNSFVVELGVTKGSKDEKNILAAHHVAIEHGLQSIFRNNLMEPRSPISDGNGEVLRKPLAKDKIVIRAKSNGLPLLIGKDGQENYDAENWQVGAKVKALIAFYPYEVNLSTGITANLRFMGLVKESSEASLHDIAHALLSSSDGEEAD